MWQKPRFSYWSSFVILSVVCLIMIRLFDISQGVRRRKSKCNKPWWWPVWWRLRSWARWRSRWLPWWPVRHWCSAKSHWSCPSSLPWRRYSNHSLEDTRLRRCPITTVVACNSTQPKKWRTQPKNNSYNRINVYLYPCRCSRPYYYNNLLTYLFI